MVSILIVDNSNLIKKTLENQFNKNNLFHLIFKSTLQEAEEVLGEKSHIFAAIVGTVLADAMNGEIIDLLLLHKVPTLVLTGQISKEVIRAYSEKPIIDYVAKTSMHDILYTVEILETLYFFQGKKALIISDTRSTQQQLSKLFSNIMFEPITLVSTEEGIDFVKENKDVDVIVFDYDTSGIDCVKFLRKLDDCCADRDIKVIAIADTFSNTETISELIKNGADEFLGKPITREEFNARVFKVLSYKKQMYEINEYSKTIEDYVLISETDERGIIRKVSQSFSDLSGFTKDELIGQPHRIVRHDDMPSEVFTDLWATVKSGKKWTGEVKNHQKNGGYYWVKAHVTPIYNNGKDLIGYRSIRQDITDKKLVEQKSIELAEAKKHITDSIEFSSIIQRAFLPSNSDIARFYDDFFVHWEPKDIVGGDIYQFIEKGDRSLLFMIDCTGHGVPGAFMTMVVKTALENIVNNENFDNPAKILQQLSKTIKSILKQHDENAKSDAGLDGGIFFYDKAQNFIRYAGAKTPLFYIIDGELKIFKGDRESIGYKKADENFDFKNFEMRIEKESYFYITTDGYIDQNGGEDGYPYGKKKFQATILAEHQEPFSHQIELLMQELKEFQSDHERDDDITLSGFVLSPQAVQEAVTSKEIAIEKEDDMIFKYYLDDGSVDIMDELETMIEKHIRSKHPGSKKLEKVLTVLYEMGQNILKHASVTEVASGDDQWKPSISAGSVSEDEFFVTSANLITVDQKEKIISRIEDISGLDQDELKAHYRELRKSGKYQHEKGAGLGFSELAKRSHKPLKYQFDPVDGDHYFYKLTVYI